MLDAIDRIARYAAVGHARFMAETQWQDAIIRQLEIVGEAAKRVSPACRARQPEIPWRRIAGLRDVLIHNYMGVDLDAVWEITRGPVPELRQRLVQVLTDEDHGCE